MDPRGGAIAAQFTAGARDYVDGTNEFESSAVSSNPQFMNFLLERLAGELVLRKARRWHRTILSLKHI